MLTSEFAAKNPTAIVEGVDSAIKAAWESMQRYRRYARYARRKSATNRYAGWDGQMAERYHHTLRLLLQIRRGEWAD